VRTTHADAVANCWPPKPVLTVKRLVNGVTVLRDAELYIFTSQERKSVICASTVHTTARKVVSYQSLTAIIQ